MVPARARQPGFVHQQVGRSPARHLQLGLPLTSLCSITPRLAGSTESVAHPYNNRTKYYAVLSVGRQTFASKKVRRAGERPSSADLLPGNSGTVALSGGSATAGVAKSGGSATAAVATSGGSATGGPAKSGGSGTAGVARSSASGTAAAGGASTRRRLEDDGVAVFRWEEGTDVVLQRSGATLAQIAVYAAGRIDGALGDKLQVGLAQLFK